MMTHHKESIPQMLGPLPSKCYSTYPQMNVGTLHVRVTSGGLSLASKEHSHEQSVVPAILKRGYYHPQVNVGIIYVRVASAGKSLARKDHSHE